MPENVSNQALSSEIGSKRPFIVAIISSNVFGLFVGCLWEYLSLRGVVSTSLSWVVLVFAWVIGVVAIVTSEWLFGKGIKHKFLWGACGCIVLAALLIGFHTAVSRFAQPLPIRAPVSSAIPPPQPQVDVNGTCNVGNVGSANTISTDCSQQSKKKE